MTRAHWLVLLVVWAISVGYMAAHLKRGWVPHDEGTLGQSAERVLNGELPHRDFDEGYTGGLTFLHALAFRELGINSASLRYVLFAAFLSWVLVVFYVASCFISAYAAAGITLLAVAWSVPNYPAPMPSWYNLFFATFGTAALLRYLDVGSRIWLFIAGICGGLSILAKIAGLYFIAAVLLFFVFREQCIECEQDRNSSQRGRLYTVVIVLGLGAFVLVLFRLIHQIPGLSGLIFFVLPAFCLVVFLSARELAGIPGSDSQRFSTLLSMGVPFGLGFVLPIAAFLIPYALTGSVHALLYGTFTVPMKRFIFAAVLPQNAVLIVEMIPFILPVVIAFDSGGTGRLICAGLLALFAAAVLIGSARSTLLYGLGWRSLAAAIPVLILAGVVILGLSRAGKAMTLLRQQQFMLIMCVTALCSIVQFPFSTPVYFFYIAPLVVLTAAALFASVDSPPRLVLATAIIFYILFAVWRVTPGFIKHFGKSYFADTQTEPVSLARAGGLRVDPSDARFYDALIPLVQAHAIGKFIYCAPDCPEVYFLSGLRNSTRTLYDFFDDPQDRTDRILRSLASHNTNVIIFNKTPEFSGPVKPDLREALEERYSHYADVKCFQVRWIQ